MPAVQRQPAEATPPVFQSQEGSPGGPLGFSDRTLQQEVDATASSSRLIDCTWGEGGGVIVIRENALLDWLSGSYL